MKFAPTSQWYGRRPSDDVDIAAAYGARAILQTSGFQQRVDLLPDRQSTFPDASNEEFGEWIRRTLLPWLENKCGEVFIHGGSDDVFVLDDGPFHAEASPQSSYGHLYIGAWMVSQD